MRADDLAFRQVNRRPAVLRQTGIVRIRISLGRRYLDRARLT